MKSTKEQFIKMTQESIPKLVVGLSIPTTVNQLISVIYNTADTYFVSQIGTSASAAVGVVFSIMAIIQAFGYGMGMGTGALVSLKLGAEKNEEAKTIASSGFVMSLVLGFFVGTVGLLTMEPLLKLIGTTDSMLPYAKDYAAFIFLSAPAMCASCVMASILRSEGEATFSTVGLCTGGIVNVILDPILIFGLKMGTRGAAVATAISQVVSFIVLLYAYLSGKSIVKLSFNQVSRDIKTYTKIVSTGLPTICRQSLGSVASALLTRSCSPYGDASVAAISIATKVYMLIRNTVIGIGQGFQPVAGYNFGAGKKKRTGQAFTFACIVGSVFCVISSVCIFAFSAQIIGWFRDDTQVITVGAKMLKIMAFAVPTMGYSTYVNQLYQCLGFKGTATFLASCRQGLFFIPMIIISTKIWGLLGVQMTQAAADIMTFFISVPFQIRFFKKELKE